MNTKKAGSASPAETSGTAPAPTDAAPNQPTSQENQQTDSPQSSTVIVNRKVEGPSASPAPSPSTDQVPENPPAELVASKAAKLDAILAKEKAAIAKPLSAEERKELNVHLGIIVKAGSDALLASLALEEIRAKRLYRDTHSEFDAFCKDVCEFSAARASQLIAAAKEYAALKDKVAPELLPTTEGALRKIREVDEASKIQVLQLAVELSSQNRPTGTSIEEAWKLVQGETENARDTKERSTKPARVLKAAKSTVNLLKVVKRESFTIGELAEMKAMLDELGKAAKALADE